MPLGPLVLCAWLLAAAAAPSRHGEDKALDARARMAAYLGEHDVVTAAELRGLDRAPAKALMAVALDGQAQGLVRARAVAALRVVATPEVQRFLGKLLEDRAESKDATDRLLLRRAAISLGWLGGPRAEQQLAALFVNEDPEVRVDAAIGLGLSRGADAPALLRRRLASEAVPRVRQQIERQLHLLEPAAEAPEKAAPKPQRPPMRGGF